MMPDVVSRCEMYRDVSTCQAAKEKAYQEALAARKAAEEAQVAEHDALSEMRRTIRQRSPDWKRLGL